MNTKKEIDNLINESWSIQKRLKNIIANNSGLFGSKEVVIRANYYLGKVEGIRTVLYAVQSKHIKVDLFHVSNWLKHYEE